MRALNQLGVMTPNFPKTNNLNIQYNIRDDMPCQMGKTVFLALFMVLLFVPMVSAFEVDLTGYVTTIYDGDTFAISSGEVIRLADVDCPERYDYGYSQATNYLAGLISGKQVYLDIDDQYRTDPYDRLVCVVYVDQGSRLLNVNQALLDSGNAVVDDYPNEFSPYTWNKYERTGGGLTIFDAILLVGLIWYLLRKRPWKKKEIVLSSDQMLCFKCNRVISKDSVYCTYCGSRIHV
jgi:hypothetical protein